MWLGERPVRSCFKVISNVVGLRLLRVFSCFSEKFEFRVFRAFMRGRGKVLVV